MSPVAFEWAADRIEFTFGLTRLESRGTLRLVLKDAGLDPNSVTGSQMKIAIEKLLPSALRKRGIADPDGRCVTIASSVASAVSASNITSSPEEVFRRIGRA